MSRAYWPVSPAFWTDEKVDDWTDDTKLLGLYLLTCKHRTLEGLFRLPKGYITEDLKWAPERLAQPFAELLRDGFIEYDEEARLCFIINALEYQAPENPNQITAAIKLLTDLPQSSLFARLLEQAERLCQPLAERLCQGLPERFGKPPTPTPTPTPTLRKQDDDRTAPPIGKSPREAIALGRLQEIASYPFDEAQDLELLREPRDLRVDAAAEVRKWRDYWTPEWQTWKKKKPPNYRLSWRNWLEQAERIVKSRDGPTPPSHAPPELPEYDGTEVPMPEELKGLLARIGSPT